MHVAQYDCSCQNQQEAALGGAVLWGLTHPLGAERPVFWYKSPVEVAEAICLYEETLEAKQRSQDVYDFAMAQWSYEAFLRQFDKILREV